MTPEEIYHRFDKFCRIWTIENKQGLEKVRELFLACYLDGVVSGLEGSNNKQQTIDSVRSMVGQIK